MKASLLLVCSLFAGATAFTLYLPEQTTVNGVISAKIDSDSMTNPVAITTTELPLFENTDFEFGVLLGSYSQLEQATNAFDSMLSNSPGTIVKVRNQEQLWFLLLNGPVSSRQEAQQQLLRSHSNGISGAKLIRWPKKQEDKK